MKRNTVRRVGVLLLVGLTAGCGAESKQETQRKRRVDAAATLPANKAAKPPSNRQSAKPTPQAADPWRLVRVTMPTGRPMWRYARVGDLLLLDETVPLYWGNTEPPFTSAFRLHKIRRQWLVPYRYRGEAKLTVEMEGPLIRVNGKVVGIDLFGLAPTRAVALLRRHRATIQTVLWHQAKRFAPPITAELAKLKSHTLTLSLFDYRGTAAAARALDPLRGRLQALIIGGSYPDGLVPRFHTLGELYVLSGGIPSQEAAAISRWPRLARLYHGPGNEQHSHRLAKRYDIEAVAKSRAPRPFPALRRVAMHQYKFSEFGLLGRVLPLEKLRELQVTGYPVYKAPTTFLSRLVRVERLSFETVDPVDTATIAQLPRLRSLSLFALRDPLQDKDLAHLGRAKGLDELELRATMVSDAGLAELRHLRGLRVLRLSGSLGYYPRQTRAHPRVGDSSLAHLAKLPMLTVLAINKQSKVAAQHRITRRGLGALSRARSLRALQLVDHRLTDSAVASLAKVPHLESLELEGRQLGDPSCRSLTALRGLKHLLIRGAKITGAGCGDLKQLRSLALWGDITNDGVKQIGRLTGLRSLVLSSLKISDPGVRHLSQLKHLRQLVLTRVSISDRALAHLAQLPRLRVLILHEAQGVTRRAVRHLRTLKSLRHLVLWNTRIAGAGAVELKSALPRCRVLVTSG